MKQKTVKRDLRIPADLDQFIQTKADKTALLTGKRPNWSRALIKILRKAIKIKGDHDE